MKVWGIHEYSPERGRAICEIVDLVSRVNYEGNLIFKRDPHVVGKAVSFTLRVVDSKEPGARRTPSGRGLPAVCWHCHRDVMRMIFALDPDAQIKMMYADYDGIEDFETTHHRTGTRNIGSEWKPLLLYKACKCEDGG